MQSKVRRVGTLAVAVTGAVGAIDVPGFMLFLRSAGLVGSVRVAATGAALSFVTRTALEVTSGAAVIDEVHLGQPGHLALTKAADALLVMPATANCIAKGAAGLADDVVSAAILAAACPVIFAPAMNDSMWSSAVVRRNVSTLRALGHRIIEPARGLEVADLSEGGYVVPPASDVWAAVIAELDARALAREVTP